MSRLGFHLLHWFWWLFSPTYRHEMSLQAERQRGRAVLVGGQVVYNVHPPEVCAGRPCAVHRPSSHHMAAWPQNWRTDRYIMERMCSHGVGHPDPDHMRYALRIAPADGLAHGLHGCDGCCSTWKG